MLSEHVMYAIARMEGIANENRRLWFENIRDDLREMDTLTAIIAAPYVVEWYTRIAKDDKAPYKRPFNFSSTETEIEKFERSPRGIEPPEDSL